MYRDEADLELLAELAGVLDATVSEAGLSPGEYLVLRRLAADGGPHAVGGLAEGLGADPAEVADLAGRLVQGGLAEVAAAGLSITDEGRRRLDGLERDANEAMRAYVMERPHTATVYGLVASMQSGRFTVEDLLEFLAEGPTDDEPGAG
jgi:DNA-binding MarR family transcriptional regulator